MVRLHKEDDDLMHDEYVLSVVYKGKPTHHLIQMNDADFAYEINKERYGLNEHTLQDLVGHFMFDDPLPKGANPWPIRLTNQYPASEDGTCSASVSEDEGGDSGDEGSLENAAPDAADANADEATSLAQRALAASTLLDTLPQTERVESIHQEFAHVTEYISGRMRLVLTAKRLEWAERDGRELTDDEAESIVTKQQATVILQTLDARDMQEALRMVRCHACLCLPRCAACTLSLVGGLPQLCCLCASVVAYVFYIGYVFCTRFSGALIAVWSRTNPFVCFKQCHSTLLFYYTVL